MREFPYHSLLTVCCTQLAMHLWFVQAGVGGRPCMHSAEIPGKPLAYLGGGKCADMGTARQRRCPAGLGGGGVRLLRCACAHALTDQPAAGLVAVVCVALLAFPSVAWPLQLTRGCMSPSMISPRLVSQRRE